MATIQPTPHRRSDLQLTRPQIAERRAVYLAVVFGYLLFLPPQLNPSVGGSLLPAYRVFLIVAALFVVASFVKRKVRFAWPDLTVILTILWICLAMFINARQEEAITASIANTSDIGLAYFFGRATIRSVRDLRVFLLCMLPGLLFLGLVLIVESLSHRPLMQNFFGSLTGVGVLYRSEPRYGLFRALGPFPHPILTGIFFTSFLPLYWQAGFKPEYRSAGSFASVCGFFTVSSATLLGLVVSTVVLFYAWLTKRVAFVTWPLFFFAAGLFIFLAELGTKSGTFSLLVRFAALNSTTSYTRINIWNYGSQNVANNPWFGIGYADWVRPVWLNESVDNFWLVTAMRFGVPASVLIGLVTVTAILMLMRKSLTSTPADAECERGVAISLAIFALGMVSVALWLSAQVWFFALLGLAVSLSQLDKPVTVIRQGQAH